LKRKKYTFLLKDVWDLEHDVQNKSNFKKKVIEEAQMLDLEIKLFFRNHALTRAADLAFTSIFALVPLLAIIFMLFKYTGGQQVVNSKIKPFIYNFLSPVSGKQISQYIDTFLNSASIETLGVLGIIFLLVTIYIIMSVIESTFDYIWHVKKSRSFFDRLKSYWLIISVSPMLLTASATLTSYLDSIVIESSLFETLYTIFAFKIMPFVLIMFFFTLIIIVLPNCKVQANHALMGGFFGTVLYYITKNLFVDYTKLAVSYDVIYGSMAVLPIFMLWLFWFWVIVLFSVEVAFVRQNFKYLKNSEKHIEINHFDKIRIAVLISIKLVENHLCSKKEENILNYSDNLNIPLNHVLNCFKDFEQAGIVKETGKMPEEFITNIPIKEITLKRIIDAINKTYIPDKSFNKEGYDNFVESIVNEYKSKEHDIDINSVADLVNLKNETKTI
jgi:membrane protein